MPGIALYLRVSDDKLREDGERRQDITRQTARLKPYLDAWLTQNPDWTDAGTFADDGKSAFKEDYQSRPEFLRLMREIKAHRVSRVYVESLDRWARRVVDGLTTLQDASDAGATVVSIAEGEIDFTQPQGWFRSLMALGMAEWASREKSWRVKQSVERRRNDARRVCKSCGETHMGAHPKVCECLKCRKKRGREK